MIRRRRRRWLLWAIVAAAAVILAWPPEYFRLRRIRRELAEQHARLRGELALVDPAGTVPAAFDRDERSNAAPPHLSGRVPRGWGWRTQRHEGFDVVPPAAAGHIDPARPGAATSGELPEWANGPWRRERLTDGE